MNFKRVARIDDPARRALAAHEAIAHRRREIAQLVALRAEALGETHAAGVAWAELARRFGVTPSRIELSKR